MDSIRVIREIRVQQLPGFVVKDGLVAVALTVPLAGEVQPAVARATAVLEEHLVEVRVVGYPLEPVAGHQLVGYREVGSLAHHVL